MRVSVIGFIIGGHLTCIPVLQLIEVERPAGVIDDAGLIASPARIGEPDVLTLFVCEWLGVFDGAGLGVIVGNVQCSAGNLSLESFLKFKTDFGLVNGQAKSVQIPPFGQVTVDFLKDRFAMRLGGHQVITPALLRVGMINQNPPVGHTGVCPRVVSLVGKTDLLAGLPADLSRHDVVAAAIWIFSIPDRRVRAVTSPSLVEVGVLGIRNLMKPCSIGVDDTDRCLPHSDLRMIFDTPKEDQFVIRLGPGWLEVPMTGRERFAFGCTEDVDMNLAILEVSRSVAFISFGLIQHLQ